MAEHRLLGQLASVLVGVLVVAAVFVGCSSIDDVTGPEEEDDGEVLQSILMDSTSEFAEWFDLDSFFGEGNEGLLGVPQLPGIELTPINTRRWYRDPIRPFGFQVSVTINGDSAFVESHTTIHGILHLWAEGTLLQDTLVHYTKVFHDQAVQRAAFIRYADSLGEFRRGWRLEYVSDVEVESFQPEDLALSRGLLGSPQIVPNISSVVLYCPETEQEWVITDPLLLRHRRDVPILPLNSDIEVTVNYSGSPALAFLHTGVRPNKHRFPLEEQEPGVFRGIWHTPIRAGIFHAAIDLLYEDTLMDDTHPYESNAWLIVYRAGGEISPG